MKNSILLRIVSVLLVIFILAACAPTATQPPAPEPTKQVEATAPQQPQPQPTQAPPTVEPTQAPAEPTESMEPKVLRIAISTNIDTFDPHLTRSFAVANVVDYMVETLVNANVNGEIVPVLAESWETSEDGKEITFFLRSGVMFSDGTPFNAEAVKYNIERFQDENLANTKNPYDKITEVIVVDENTVKLRMEKPSSELLPAMSNTNIAMLSPASIPQDGEA